MKIDILPFFTRCGICDYLPGECTNHRLLHGSAIANVKELRRRKRFTVQKREKPEAVRGGSNEF